MLNSQAISRIIEAPWSPAAEFLPIRRTPEQSGNTSLPYRDASSTVCLDRLSLIRESEKQISITRWSNLYEFSIPLHNLHPYLENRTILHLSDVHFLKGDPRPIHELQMLTRWLVENEVYPDFIVFTGDVITKLPDDLCDASLRSLGQLASLASHALFVHGNHDFHGQVPHKIAQSLERIGFQNLTNERYSVSFNGGQINFYGVDDAYFGAPKAPQSMNKDQTNIILVHNLDAIRSNFSQNSDLILSGHTHWGELNQSALFKLPVFDGMWWMGKWGYSDNINCHTRHWDALTERTLSFVHPGLARYYVPRILAYPPGFVLHKLQSMAAPQPELDADFVSFQFQSELRAVA